MSFYQQTHLKGILCLTHIMKEGASENFGAGY